jgi:hypothetical protein
MSSIDWSSMMWFEKLYIKLWCDKKICSHRCLTLGFVQVCKLFNFLTPIFASRWDLWTYNTYSECSWPNSNESVEKMCKKSKLIMWVRYKWHFDSQMQMKNSHVSNTNVNHVNVGVLSTCGHQTLNKSFAVTMTSQMMEYERLAFRFCRVTRNVYQLIRIDTFDQLRSACPI